jgi:hypothetical protein
MTKVTIPTNSNRVIRFFDSLEVCLGIPERIISDGSPAFVSAEVKRLVEELCESTYEQEPAPNQAPNQAPRKLLAQETE